MKPPKKHVDPPRLLHRRSEKGYTTEPHEALQGEHEAVDAQTLEQYAQENWERFNEMRSEERQREEARSLAAKLREAEARARKQGIDVRDELSHIHATIKRVNDKLRKAA